MRIVTADDLKRLFTYPRLVDALREGFRQGAVVPVRHHHQIDIAGESAATLLLMPAWDDLSAETLTSEDHYLGVKLVTVYPGNAARGRPSVTGLYVLMDGRSGEPLAVIDGTALTLWRTAAASALAASYLARNDAERLLMVGAGALAPHIIAAHASMRRLSEISIWNRNPERAEGLAETMKGGSVDVRAVRDLQASARGADIISCATLSRDPLIKGEWLSEGTHLDLIGAYTPEMRETDDEAVRRARVFVDTREGALKEAGDIVQPLRNGVIQISDVEGDFFELCRGSADGRRGGEITLFKSVGTAIEDLAAATLAYRQMNNFSRNASVYGSPVVRQC